MLIKAPAARDYNLSRVLVSANRQLRSRKPRGSENLSGASSALARFFRYPSD